MLDQQVRALYAAVSAKGFEEELAAVSIRTSFYGNQTRYFVSITFKSYVRNRGYDGSTDGWDYTLSLDAALAHAYAWAEKLDPSMTEELGWEVLGGRGP